MQIRGFSDISVSPNLKGDQNDLLQMVKAASKVGSTVNYFFKFLISAMVEGDARDSCKVTPFGCCPNGVSSADGPDYKGCQVDEKIES